jgi:hypothetical protein
MAQNWRPPRRSGRRGTVRPGERWGEYLMSYDGSWVRPRDGHVWGTPEPMFQTIIERGNLNNGMNGYNTNETEAYSVSNHGMNRGMNRGAENSGLGPQPLSRQQSALERYQSVQLTSEGEETDLLTPPSPGHLERFYSVEQSRLRFVLYTSSQYVIDQFTSGNGFIRQYIQLLYNSTQTVPIDYVFVDASDQGQVDRIKARLPASVQHIGQGFSDSQINDSLTTDDHFLLTVEPDIQDSRRPVFGILCCSFETVEVSSQDFVDGTGTPILNFQSGPGDIYVYVHLFTFLSDRASGDEFFTGSHMLEGLYLLFNYEEDNTMIYLEAITVQPTLDFYDRFGMERIALHPVSGGHFDPFKNVDVPDEVPYVLYDHNQIQVASVISYRARQTRMRQGRGYTRIMDLVQEAANAALLQPITDEDREMIERSLSVYNHTYARRDPRPPNYNEI